MFSSIMADMFFLKITAHEMGQFSVCDFIFVRGERDRRELAWRRFLPVRQSKSDSKLG